MDQLNNNSNQEQERNYFTESGEINEEQLLNDSNIWGESEKKDEKEFSLDDLGLDEENKTEQEKKEPVKKEVKDDRLSPKFALLAKKEAKIRQQEKEFEQKRKEFETFSKEFEGLNKDDVAATKDFKKLLNEAKYDKAVAVDLLEMIGVNIDDLKNIAAKPDSSRDMAKLQKRIDELQDIILKSKEDGESKYNSFVKDQVEGRLELVKKDIMRVANNNSEKYDLLLANEGFVNDVLDVQKEYYKIHGESLTHEEAMSHVQNYYEEQLAKTLGKSKRFASVFNKSEQPKSPNQPRTLTSDLTNQRVTKSLDEMTMEEREAYAFSILEN